VVRHNREAGDQEGQLLSVKELIAKIEHFVVNYNKNKAPFAWTAKRLILEKLNKLCEYISGTVH
jgi:putative transposase